MRYLSVCSGIEAASVAWSPLGWQAVAFAEIEKFPSAVLASHYPDVPNLGDMNKINGSEFLGKIDILVGGTPCQSFSLAGLRLGLKDERGNLSLEFVRLANECDPAFVVWENVPGVFSDRGNAFGCFLAALAGEDAPLLPPGGKWSDAGYVLGPSRTIAWRILDAQYFGLAQRRRRVFLVACPLDGADPRKILFEWEGVRRDTSPGQEQKKNLAPTLAARTRGGGGHGTDFECDGGLIVESATCFGGNASGSRNVATALNAPAHSTRLDFSTETFVVVGAEGFDASEDGTGRANFINFRPRVRRMTPLEWERLQGLPDGYADILFRGKPAADSPRYKVVGNSMPVPVMRWIGERIIKITK